VGSIGSLGPRKGLSSVEALGEVREMNSVGIVVMVQVYLQVVLLGLCKLGNNERLSISQT
jgi:hypothetical protein